MNLFKKIETTLPGKNGQQPPRPIMSAKYVKNAAGEYVCPHCPKICDKQNTMFYHIAQEHEDEKPFNCKACSTGFIQRSQWLKHLAHHHPEAPHPEGIINPYVGVAFHCPSCEHEPIKTKQQLVTHYVRTHCTEFIPKYVKGEPCSQCLRSFKSPGAYLYHTAECFLPRAPPDHASIISRIK